MASRGIKGDLFQTPDAPVVELVEPPRLVERPYRKKRLRALERPVHPRQVEALPDDALAPIFRNSRLFMSFSLCAKVCKKRGGLSNRGGQLGSGGFEWARGLEWGRNVSGCTSLRPVNTKYAEVRRHGGWFWRGMVRLAWRAMYPRRPRRVALWGKP